MKGCFKPWFIVLVLAFVLIQYKLWFESGGILQVMHLRKKLYTEHVKLDDLTARNHQLIEQVKRLKSGHQSVEAKARQDLGLVKKDEVFYQIVDSRQGQRKENEDSTKQ